MNRKALLKISIFSITFAVLLSFCSLVFLNNFALRQSARFRDEFLLFFASSIERKIQGKSFEEIRSLGSRLLEEDGFRPPPPGMHPHDGKRPPPPMMGFMGDSPPPPPPFDRPGGPPTGDPRRGPRDPLMVPQIWIISEFGNVVAQRRKDQDPLPWTSLPHPEITGAVQSKDEWLGFGSSYAMVKLNAKQDLYLVLKENKKSFLGPLFLTQGILTAGMSAVAILGSFGFLFFYLRRKSEEARSVLRRLESGDLKARFQIQRFDEFGELLLDFNRMADEIETLVGRIHKTEQKRKTLLQELGHDLRTPLTSLKTNFEILQQHQERLSSADKANLFGVLSGEIDYFKDLIEKLITIASLDEPHYKATTEKVDMHAMISQEVKLRQKSHDNKIKWICELSGSPLLLGDSHLILRLLRNGLDNAARYAEKEVRVVLEPAENNILVHIYDDGPGLDDEALKTFGERHEFRGRRLTKGGHFSLGLGSVIMKTIAELHHGSLNISNSPAGGAHLKIELPAA